MPNNQKKRKKRRSLRELFKISNCMSPQTSSPDIDEMVQNGQVNNDVFKNNKELQSSTDIGEISTEKSYSVEYTTNTPEYFEELAEMNRNESDGYATNTAEYDTELAEQKRNEADGYVTNTPEQRCFDENNKCDSDEYTRKSSELRALDIDQKRFDEMRKDDDTISIGACSLLERDEEMDTSSDTNDDNKPIGAGSESDINGKMDNAADRNKEASSIGACSLSNTDKQEDTTTNNKDDTASSGACALKDTDEQMDTTTDNKDDTASNGACALKDTDKQMNTKTNNKDDTSSIGACSLSDTEDQMGLYPIVVDDNLENSNASGKETDSDYISPRTGLYIDPMLMDSQREIILNLKNLIEQNVKQIKEMRRQKAKHNIDVHKAELRLERSEKDINEMNAMMKTFKEDFWEEAEKFPAAVSLKYDKFDNVKVKNQQDLVDHLNAMKRKEKLLKEVIPKLKRENAMKKTWSPTIPPITFSPVIEQLNVQFESEFGTRLDFKLLKPGIYIRDPFTRTTYHVPEDKIEDFKLNNPYLYYNCQCFIDRKDIENFHQQTEEYNGLNKTNHNLEMIKEETEEQISEVENNKKETNKRKAMANETGLKMKRYDGKNLGNGQDKTVFNGGEGLKTQIGGRKTVKETPKKHETKKGVAVEIVLNKSQTTAKNIKKPIVKSKIDDRMVPNKSQTTAKHIKNPLLESKIDDKIVPNKSHTTAKNIKKPLVESKIDDGKVKTIKKVTSKIPKQGGSEKMKIDTKRYSEEMTVNNKDKENKRQKNIKVDKKILERVEKLKEMGKDVYIKTTGDKSFIYIKPAGTQITETGNDQIKRKNRLLVTTVSKGKDPLIEQMTVCKPPPVYRTDYAAMDSIVPRNQTNAENVSHGDNIQVRVHAKPVIVKGKTKIPLIIRKKMPNKTPTPRRKPNTSVPSPRIKLENRQSKHGVIEKKSFPSRSRPTNIDELNNKTVTGLDISNADEETAVSIEKSANAIVVSPKGTLEFPKVLTKQLQSLIPISMCYIKEKGQNNELARETTPRIHIVAKVIDAYITTEKDEIPVFGNPEVGENQLKNSRHDIIPMKENEKKRAKETLKPLKPKDKRISKVEEDNVITNISRNVVVLPPIRLSTSPTKRGRTRPERCKSSRANKDESGNTADSLNVNVNSKLNDSNSLSVTGTQSSMVENSSSGKLYEDRCQVLPKPPVKKNDNIIIPHPPEATRNGSKHRTRRNVRTPKENEMKAIAKKLTSKTNKKFVEALEQRSQSTARKDCDSIDNPSRSSSTITEHTNIITLD